MTTVPSPGDSRGWKIFKDAIDVVSKLATVLIAIVVFQYNSRHDHDQQAFQNQQARLQEVQTVTSLFPHLTSADIQVRHLALAALRVMTTDTFAIDVCLSVATRRECSASATAFPPVELASLGTPRDTQHVSPAIQQVARTAAETLQARPDSEAVRRSVLAASPAASHDSTVKINGVRQGWVFLGSYDSTTGSWQSRYFEFGVSAKPSSLKGHTLQVPSRVAGVNVRRNRFYEAGYDEILDVLKPGSTVNVGDVRSWNDGGYYIWASVTYSRAQ